MSHIERKLREKENLRKAMLSAALEIAGREGWQAVTIRKIAEAIDYTAPIVYEHFHSKEDLIGEIIHNGYGTMIEHYQEVFEQELEPKEMLLEISLRHWDFAFENTVLYQLMFSLERQKPGEEVIQAMTTIKEAFMKFTNKQGCEVFPLIFNWICLMNGTISTFMMFDGNTHPKDKDMHLNPRSIYRSFLERFLKSITL